MTTVAADAWSTFRLSPHPLQALKVGVVKWALNEVGLAFGPPPPLRRISRQSGQNSQGNKSWQVKSISGECNFSKENLKKDLIYHVISKQDLLKSQVPRLQVDIVQWQNTCLESVRSGHSYQHCGCKALRPKTHQNNEGKVLAIEKISKKNL